MIFNLYLWPWPLRYGQEIQWSVTSKYDTDLFMYGLEYMHVTHRLNELDMYDKLFENPTEERIARTMFNYLCVTFNL